MRLDELLNALAARGSRVAADGGRLRRVGPRFAEGDPVRRALGTFHDEILWLLTSARLCVNCPRLLAAGDKIACAEHSGTIKETPMSWDQSNTIANSESGTCRNVNGVCQNQQHDHFDFDKFFDDWRAEQQD